MAVIDIYSKAPYPACALSNFAAHPFVFESVECGGMEGFLQSLKYKNIKKQRKVCLLSGKEAKAAGAKKRWWKLSGNLWWQGKRYKRRSAEFFELRVKAYRALLKNQNFAAALRAAGDSELAHSIGGHNMRTTILTEEEFISILNIIRK